MDNGKRDAGIISREQGMVGSKYNYILEKREFIRVKLEVAVRYKFLAKHFEHPAMERVYEGTTKNLSGGGLLLRGDIPIREWIPELLLGKIAIGVNIHLPTHDLPIKALCRVAWIEAWDEVTSSFALGLRFREITDQEKNHIFDFIIKSQLPS